MNIVKLAKHLSELFPGTSYSYELIEKLEMELEKSKRQMGKYVTPHIRSGHWRTHHRTGTRFYVRETVVNSSLLLRILSNGVMKTLRMCVLMEIFENLQWLEYVNKMVGTSRVDKMFDELYEHLDSAQIPKDLTNNSDINKYSNNPEFGDTPSSSNLKMVS